MKLAQEIQDGLAQFYGSENHYKFSPFSKLVMTEGVKYLCDNAESYWFLDIIVSYQPRCMKDEMLRDFQIWTLRVKDKKGKVTCERDTDNVAITQKIEYTGFPLTEIKLYCENGVIYLPSER